MEQEQINIAFDEIFKAITNSEKLTPINKLELLGNMRTFLESYNENIKILNKEIKKKC